MRGHFTVKAIGDLGLGDAPFIEAMKNNDIDGLLKRHPITQKAETDNQVFHTVLQYMMLQVFGLPSVGTFGSVGAAGWAKVALSSTSTEPTYTDYSGTTWYASSALASADSWVHTWTLQKRFWDDRAEPTRIWMDTDREALYYRDRWLWLPSHGVFSNIRSVRSYGNDDADLSPSSVNSTNTWRASRTRLKDSGGNPVTLQKSASEGFLIEYLIKMFSR